MSDLNHNLIHRWNAGDALRRSAARAPGQRAILFQGRELSYAELDALSNRFARLLMAKGTTRGDAVAIFAANSPEFVAAFFACARIGAVLVPINLMFTADDVDYVMAKTHVKVLLVEPMFLGKVNQSPEIQILMDGALRETLSSGDGSPVEQFVGSDDPLLTIFTSGTTARPKGVVLTHLNFYASLLSSYADYKADRTLRYGLVLPLFHIAGLALAFACYATGCDSVMVPFAKADLILNAIVSGQVGTIALPATLWVGLLNTPGIETADLSCLRRLLVFQYLPTPVFQRWREMTPHAEWINCWGQTETTGLGSATPAADLGSMLASPDPIGLRHMPVELRIVDDEMNDVALGTPGEIVVRGPSLTPGYFEEPEANEALFRGGWHHTGDIAYIDDHGWLYFHDRKKDMIKSGGENISSQEVEESIAQHPAVAEVAVIGLPDPYWIEKVVACVVALPNAEITGEELLVYTRSRLAGYKVPKQIHVMQELPKNPTGKVLKRVLREKLAISN